MELDEILATVAEIRQDKHNDKFGPDAQMDDGDDFDEDGPGMTEDDEIMATMRQGIRPF